MDFGTPLIQQSETLGSVELQASYFSLGHTFFNSKQVQNSNNYSKLLTLKLLTIQAVDKRVRALQVFKDSSVAINCMQWSFRPWSLTILPTLEQVKLVEFSVC